MRGLRLLLLTLVVVGVGGAQWGPIKPLGPFIQRDSTSPMVVPATSDPCKEADAFLNYSAALIAGTDEIQETSVANAGLGGSTWDADTAVSGGLTFQQAGDCTGSTGPCLVSDATGADNIYMSADVAKTWTFQMICQAAYISGTGSAFKRSLQVSGDVSSRNVSGINNGTDMIYHGSGAAGSTVPVPWGTFRAWCVDLTDATDVQLSANGGAINSTDQSGSNFRNIERISLLGRFDGSNPCNDCEVSQVIAWDADPGMDVQEMSECLLQKWGSL